MEADETYIGGEKPGKRGRGAAGKALVLVAVEDKVIGIGRIRLGHVSYASSCSILQFMQDNVEPVTFEKLPKQANDQKARNPKS